MRMPNFLVIGAARSGTSSLYYYLKQHPEVYMSPVKETNFFALEGEELDFAGLRTPGLRRSITDIEAYRELFEGVSKETAIGEASPSYLYSPKAPARIGHHVPDAKLIAILRNPAERAFSHFLFFSVAIGCEPLADFAQAIREEERRARDNWEWSWHYVRLGFYAAQLERYFRLFDENQIRIYLYEDLESDPIGLLQDIFRFLGVDEAFAPDTSIRHNPSGIPRSRGLHAFLRALQRNPVRSLLRPLVPNWIRRWLNRPVGSLWRGNLASQKLAPDMRRQLIDLYRDDILRLQELINRDLTGWLE